MCAGNGARPRPAHLGPIIEQGRISDMRIGILTGGGDCPGLNAVIRAVVRKGIQDYGDEFVGFRDGWRGVLEADTVPMDLKAIRGILPRGGTVLGTSRTNPYSMADGEAKVFATLEKLGVEALRSEESRVGKECR